MSQVTSALVLASRLTPAPPHQVGCEWVVGREVSAQPPWSMETSMITAPCFIAFTVAAEINFGALEPGTAPRR